MSLEGRTALITGGGRGIGRATAIRLAREGARIAINYKGNAEAADDAKRLVEKGDDRSARGFGELLDQVERMADVVVDDHDGHVGVVAKDERARIRHRRGAGRHFVTEFLEQLRGALQGVAVLVGGEYAQAARRRFVL